MSFGTTLSIQSVPREAGSHRGGLTIRPAVCLVTTAYSRHQTFQANILTELRPVLEKLNKFAEIYQERSVLCSSLIINIWENFVWNFKTYFIQNRDGFCIQINQHSYVPHSERSNRINLHRVLKNKNHIRSHNKFSNLLLRLASPTSHQNISLLEGTRTSFCYNFPQGFFFPL